jgi:hypothetical protein
MNRRAAIPFNLLEGSAEKDIQIQEGSAEKGIQIQVRPADPAVDHHQD